MQNTSWSEKQDCLEIDWVLISTTAYDINTHLSQAMNTVKTPPIAVVPRWHQVHGKCHEYAQFTGIHGLQCLYLPTPCAAYKQ